MRENLKSKPLFSNFIHHLPSSIITRLPVPDIVSTNACIRIVLAFDGITLVGGSPFNSIAIVIVGRGHSKGFHNV